MGVLGDTLKKTVVYIDDDPDMIRLVNLILRPAGFTLVGVSDGREGLETVRRLKPDLVLLDLMMPDMDGEQIHQAMKADAELREIPIIIVTAKTLSRHLFQECDYIAKPFRIQRLVSAVQARLGA